MLKLCLLMSIIAPSLEFYTNSDVININDENFNKLVYDTQDIWVVEFYAHYCGHCKNFAPEYKRIASALKGLIKVGAVDGENNQQLTSRYPTPGIPAVFIFGQNRNNPEQYEGSRQATDIISSVLVSARKIIDYRMSKRPKGQLSVTVALTDYGYTSLTFSPFFWLVLEVTSDKYYAVIDEWEKVAVALRGKIKVGIYEPQNGETVIRFIPQGDKPILYDGEYSPGCITDWALDILERKKVPLVWELTSQQVLNQTCWLKTLCIVAFLPQLSACGSNCRSQYIDILKLLGQKSKLVQWGLLWSEIKVQKSLEEILEIKEEPALAVISFVKNKFAVFRGRFTLDGIEEFLKILSRGMEVLQSLQDKKTLKILNVKRWDELGKK